MTQACPGNCNTWWRALTTEQQAASETRPRPGDPVWCTTDFASLHRRLAEVDVLACQYGYQATGYTQQGADPLRNGHTARSPSPAADYLLDLQGFFFDWEDAYRAEHNRCHPGIPWPSAPYRGDLFPALTGVIGWLSAHLADLCTYEDIAADFGSEVLHKHRQLMALTRAGSGRRLGRVPCPWCEYMFLTLEDGADYWVCGNPGPPPCRCRLRKADYDKLAGELTRHLERAG